MNAIRDVNLESTCDYAGKRVLGMSGSLMNYINTGNAYSGIADSKKDSFESSIKKTLNKKDLLVKIVCAIGISLGIAGAISNLKKKGNFNFKMPDKLSGLKGKVGQTFSKIKDKIKIPNIKIKLKH